MRPVLDREEPLVDDEGGIVVRPELGQPGRRVAGFDQVDQRVADPVDRGRAAVGGRPLVRPRSAPDRLVQRGGGVLDAPAHRRDRGAVQRAEALRERGRVAVEQEVDRVLAVVLDRARAVAPEPREAEGAEQRVEPLGRRGGELDELDAEQAAGVRGVRDHAREDTKRAERAATLGRPAARPAGQSRSTPAGSYPVTGIGARSRPGSGPAGSPCGLGAEAGASSSPKTG